MSRYDLALGRKSKMDPAKQKKIIVEEFQEATNEINVRRRRRQEEAAEETRRIHQLGEFAPESNVREVRRIPPRQHNPGMPGLGR